MKKKTLLQLAKLQKTGTILEEPLASQLKEELLSCASYQKAAKKPDMVLKVLTKRIFGRRMKTVFITYGSTSIPVVATKLYAAKKKRGCKTCGQTRCFKTANNRLMREVVKDQIKRFRSKIARRVTKLRVIGDKRTAAEAEEFRTLTTCALSGKPLLKTHVDHVVPFVELVRLWAEDKGLNLCEKRLNMRDLDDWSTYHDDNAVLQLTDATANMRAGAKGYKQG